MLTLCGFALSNYYNKVKIALLEKGVAFEEKFVWIDQSSALLEKSPLGKVPFLETESGTLAESQVMCDYLEAQYPEKPLLPSDPFAAAKVRELLSFLELHLELVARSLYEEAFFGGKVSDEVKASTEKQLRKSIKAFARLAKFSPYLAGESFTVADCAAVVHFPLIAMATERIYGEDFLAQLPVREYVARINERPSAQRVNADRKAAQAALLAKRKGNA